MHIIEDNFYNALTNGYAGILKKNPYELLIEMIDQSANPSDYEKSKGEFITVYGLKFDVAIRAVANLQAAARLVRGFK